MTVTNTPRHEELTGADLTGSEPDSNRTYALAYANSIVAGIQLVVANTILQYTTDFTLSSGVITFLNPVWDNQVITIDYYTQVTEPSGSGTGYTTTLCAVQYMGVGNIVYNEDLGTGADGATSYDLQNANVIAGSYKLTYGDVGDNDLTELDETDDYTLTLGDGLILLTSAGVAKVDGKKIYATYTYSPKISDAELAIFLDAATEEVDKLTGTYWGDVKTTTEYHDGEDYDSGGYSDAPYVNVQDNVNSIVLNNRNIQSITSVTFLNKTGGTNQEVDTDYIDFYDWGELIFQNARIPYGRKNIKIVYTHGLDAVPALIKELTSLIIALMTYAKITGGSYDDATMFTLGRKSVSIGEVYVNVARAIKNFEDRRDTILKQVGRKMDVF